MPIENGPEVPMCEGEVKGKPATADSSKQVNGRVKQKKKKKRKRDSSEEDHISLEHLRRKKRLEAQSESLIVIHQDFPLNADTVETSGGLLSLFCFLNI